MQSVDFEELDDFPKLVSEIVRCWMIQLCFSWLPAVWTE